MRRIRLLILLLTSILINIYPQGKQLSISDNGRYFTCKSTGKPFFPLCDTAWNLAALTEEEVDEYLKSRVHNGFNTIMFALNFYPQAQAENAYGEPAFVGEHLTELNPANLTHIRYILDKCNEKGLYAMLYTMWAGEKAGTMNNYTEKQLYEIGIQVGEALGGRENLIFITAGESTPHYIDTQRVEAMGKGLKEGCNGQNLVAVHPVSEHSTAEFFSEAEWLDFYTIQGKSGIRGADYNYLKLIDRSIRNKKTKPTILIEHRYESGRDEPPIIQRRPLYISTFSGCTGYAYGHNALWQMTPHTAQKWMLTTWRPGVDHWREALYTEASNQLQHIMKLAEHYPYPDWKPDDSLLLTEQSKEINEQIRVVRNGDLGQNNASYILAYIPTNKEFAINTSSIPAKRLKVKSFDPRTGEIKTVSKNIKNSGRLNIPNRQDGEDWVFIIEKR